MLRRAEPESDVEIHPADARARGLTDGERVRVWNDRGAVANALTSDRLGDLGNGPTFCDALVEVSRLAS